MADFLFQSEDWKVRANCAQEGAPPMEAFFPKRGGSKMTNEAITCCFYCPVINDCREYRKRTGSDYGIWAGQVVNPETLAREEDD